MQHDGRRILFYHPRIVAAFRNALVEARSDLTEMHLRHLSELADLRHKIDELREVVQLVVSLLRQQAEMDVKTLGAQLLAVLVRLQRRDPSVTLQ